MLKNFLRLLKSRDVEYWLTSVKKDGVEYAVLGYRIPGHPSDFTIMRNGDRAFSPDEVMRMHCGFLMGSRLNLARFGFVRVYKDAWDEWCLDENLGITPPKGRPSYIVCLKTGEVYPEFYGGRDSTRIGKRWDDELGERTIRYLRSGGSSRFRCWYCLGGIVYFTESRKSILNVAERLTAQP